MRSSWTMGIADPRASSLNASGDSRSARASAGCPGSTERRAPAPRVARAAGQRQRASERLAPVRERAVHERAQGRDGARARRAAPAAPSRRSGPGRRRARRSGARGERRSELGEDAGDAVGAAAGLCAEALADLALDHREPKAHGREILDRAKDRARGDPVRKVRNDLRRRRSKRREVELKRVARDEVRCVAHTARARHEAAARARDRSRPREGRPTRSARYSERTPNTAADLEHDVVAAESSAARAITPRMFESTRKFWPSSRRGDAELAQRRTARLSGSRCGRAHQPNTRRRCLDVRSSSA